MEYDGLEVALVKFDNGTLGKVSVNADCIMPYRFPIRIFGSGGTVFDNRIWSHKFPGQTNWMELPTVLPDSSDVSHHPFQGEIDHFIECLRGPRVSLQSGRRSQDARDCLCRHRIVQNPAAGPIAAIGRRLASRQIGEVVCSPSGGALVPRHTATWLRPPPLADCCGRCYANSRSAGKCGGVCVCHLADSLLSRVLRRGNRHARSFAKSR